MTAETRRGKKASRLKPSQKADRMNESKGKVSTNSLFREDLCSSKDVENGPWRQENGRGGAWGAAA